jgi:type I restriction enzyme R subunit
MTPHAFTEDQLCEQPALQVLASLGWATLSGADEVFGEGGTLGRDTPGEAVLVPRLQAALRRLNPDLSADAIQAALAQLIRDRSAMSIAAANREVYDLLKDGVMVSVTDPDRGGQREERVRVIDWTVAAGNEFLAVSQLSVTGLLYTRRPDVVGFVNGLPWVVIEFKKPGVPARQAFDDNLTAYKSDIPQLFWSNALLIASNGTESRVGSLTADWDRFFEWKRIEREDEPRRVSLEVMLRGVCEPARLLDVAENFTVFSQLGSRLIKINGQNHQFLGVNQAIKAALDARREGHGRGGVFWQTQGSGKSLSMVFFAQKILRRVPGNWTFVIVTDRTELDDQIARTFKGVGAVSEAEGDECHASSGAHLRELLRGNHRYVFTLIQKFQTPEMLCDRRDVIVLTDEAHRSQYDTLALNMRAALPKALFLAFTGTPLIAGEERTREVFGDYVSIYDFEQSVQDGATVPLYYENRTPELKLENPELNDDLYDLVEAAQLDESQEAALERELSRQYHLITRDDRLETVAADVVQHFLGRGFQGKAMVISIDKATALRMYDKVRRLWIRERRRVETELTRRYPKEAGTEEYAELVRRLETLKSTDMALVVSPGQNEVEEMRRLGLDIVPHRKRMNDEALDEKFKDPDDPLRLVFVCAMWLTGFDAPSCSTIYLDKPMRNHTLMQTIARANRVFPGKHSGLIVDYANVFASLERALAIYGKGSGGSRPVRDKKKLVNDLREAVAGATVFCAGKGVDLEKIESIPSGSMERLTLVSDAVERLISPDPLRKEFLGHERLVSTLYGAIRPDPAALEFFLRVTNLATIAGVIHERTGEGRLGDISGIMASINKLLDESIAADGYHIREGTGGGQGKAVIDISKLDFEALAGRFRASDRKNIELEELKAAIKAMLERMVERNPTRTDYLARFEELIDSYNAGSRNIEEMFEELLALSRELSEEQQRHVREQLSDEELTIFDILTRPGPELTSTERDEVKKVARGLLEKVKAAIVLDWRRKAQARAKIRLLIEDTLDEGLPRAYTPDVYHKKVSAIFEHVYESFPGAA